ncbi:MAG: IS630 family transposase [Rhodopila sp.]
MLKPEEQVYLLAMMRRQINSAVHRRMNVLLLLDDGWPAERIAEALFIEAETVRQHRRLYETGGVKGLEMLRYQSPEPALSKPQLQALEAELDQTLYMTSKAVCHFVEQELGVAYTPNAMTRLLKRLGYVYKKPKCVPAKADAAVQQQFHDEILAPLMKRAGADRPLYFVDGMHPAYTGHPAYGWIRRGADRELKSNHGRVNVNINSALSWPAREVVHLEAEKITSAAMIALFERLEARHPAATAIDVVIDNASYNRSAALKAWLARDGCRIRLVYLPPYAPNLNLIERLWLLLKKAVLWNEHYATFGAFKAAIAGFFQNIEAYRDQLTSLISSVSSASQRHRFPLHRGYTSVPLSLTHKSPVGTAAAL